MKKLLGNIEVLMGVYTMGFATWILVSFLRVVGFVRLNGKIPRLKPGDVGVCNHPDACNCMLEIFLWPGIFFWQVARHPLKLAPYFMPDHNNFTKRWYWFWLKPFAIPVQRGTDHKVGSEANKMLKIARSKNRVMLLFPGGGRDCTGKIFRHGKNGRNKIRKFKESVALLVLKNSTPIFATWIGEKIPAPDQQNKPLFSIPTFVRGPITINFGGYIEFSKNLDRSQVTEIIENHVLDLVDQE